jgi:hypothetical protein
MQYLGHLDPKELLAFGLVTSEPVFKKALKDCHRLLAEISAERAEKAATPGGLGNVP